MTLAPIVLFVYNRPDHTEQTLRHLRANELAAESDLFIFADGPRNPGAAAGVDAVRRLIGSVDGFRSVTLRESVHNKGLGASVIDGVSELCAERGRVIVLEDDLVTSPWFLRYMNDGLDTYRDDEQVVSIHGYTYPVPDPLPETFFLLGADCWGWATWARGWALFEPDGAKLLAELRRTGLMDVFDFGGEGPYLQMLKDQIAGRNDSWAIRWYAAALLEGGLTLYPGRSLIHNIGTDASGTHGALRTRSFSVELARRPVRVSRIPIEDSAAGREAFSRFWHRKQGGVLRRVARRVVGAGRGLWSGLGA